MGVALKGEDDDTVTVEFVVQDTGKGIAEEQKSKLFVEFSQVEGGKCKTNEAGTGLGLFLVKNLVELMNGSVFVSSKLGVGSTFGFSIKMEKQYLAFRTPGYDHVVTVSSALQANPTTDSSSTKVPVTPGLACSTTPQISAEGRDQKTDANKDPKDYFNLQPVEDRANANNITLRTRDNALLSNRPYYFHSQCGFFEEFLCNTTSSQWNALSAKRLSYEECLHGWGKNQKVDDPLSHFGDVYLIDVSPTTNRPKNTPVLTDQEHTRMFLEKLSQQLISRAQSRIGKARQGSLILFYPFGHPPSVTQGPLSYLSAYYQITLCRKPVSERALGSMVKKLIVRMQEEPLPSTPGAMNPWSDVSPEVDPTLARVAEYSSRRSPRVVESTQRSASLSSGSENEQTTSSSGSDKEPTFSFEGSYKDSLDVGSAMEQSSPSMENFRLVLPRPDSKRKNVSKLSHRKAASSTETEESSSLAQVRIAKKKNLTTSPLVTESTSENKIRPTLAKYHPKIKRTLMSSESVQDLNESGKNVLIVDDNPLNRGLLYQQLKNLGVARIDRACSGQEAVDLFQPGVHAIVLMDLKMPTMSGFQATALLREKERAHFGSDSSQHATESTRMLNNPHDCGDIRAIGIMDNCPWSPERFASPVSKKSRRTSSPLPEMATVTSSSSSTDASSETPSSKSYARKCATIVAVTADWTAEIGEDREKALNGGFDDVMVKPMSLQSLTVLLDRYVH